MGAPPAELARRYVELLGGASAVVALAGRYMRENDLRFAATLLNHAVFADPGDSAARGLLAQVYTRLGHGAENATWRNFYLTGAQELTGSPSKPAAGTISPDLLSALTAEQVFDSLAIRVNGPGAWNERFAIDWHLTDTGEHHRTTMSNGALIHERNPCGNGADLTLRLTKERLMSLITGDTGGDGLAHDGDLTVLRRLTAVLEQPTPDFAIVTP
ncbi:hypothetical protein GCM10020001_110580 [Nonomuraea salmonea]